MNIRERICAYIPSALGIVFLISLPGCRFFEGFSNSKSNDSCSSLPVSATKEVAQSKASMDHYVSPDDTSEVFAYMDGKPIVTRGQIDAMIDSNPQLQQMKAIIDPVQIYYQFLQGLINKVVVNEYVIRNGLNKTAEYQKKLTDMIDSVTNMLNIEVFSQSLPIRVSDSAVREFYENNKDKIPELMVSRGGVQAACVHFDEENAAQAFLDKVEQVNGDIKKAAESAGLLGKFKDFMLINNQSFGYDPIVRAKILDMKNVPGSELCKVNDGSFYVVTASSKEEPTYKSYDTIKKQLKEYLEGEERKKVATAEINTLSSQYKITKSEPAEEMIKKAEQAMPPIDMISGEESME